MRLMAFPVYLIYYDRLKRATVVGLLLDINYLKAKR